MNFGTVPEYSFSFKTDWAVVSTFTATTSSPLLLRPNKFFKAFDYGAERYYFPGSNMFLLNENVSLLVFF